MNGKHVTTYGALGVGIVAISFGAIFTRLAGSPAPMVAALRMMLSSLLLAPFALGSAKVRSELALLSRRDLALVGLSGLFLALHFILWISSLSLTGVTASVVLVTTSPLWVALFTLVFLKDKISRVFWIGLALAIVGGAIIGRADAAGDGGRWQGDLLAVGGAVAIAGYFLAGSRLRKRLSLLAYIFPVYSFAAVILLGGALVAKVPLAGYGWESYGYCLLMAIVCQVLGHSVFNWALRHLAATVVAIAALGEPVGASVLALLLLGEVPHRAEIAGGVLILLGVFLVLSFSPESARAKERIASRR